MRYRRKSIHRTILLPEPARLIGTATLEENKPSFGAPSKESPAP